MTRRALETVLETGSGKAIRPAWRGHLGWLLGCGAILGASYLVPWHKSPVSPCVFLNLTGYPCATCGSTRAFQAMAHGRFAEAVAQNPLASLLFLGILAAFAWHALALGLIAVTRRDVLPRLTFRPRWWMFAGLGMAVLANWAYRLGAGLK